MKEKEYKTNLNKRNTVRVSKELNYFRGSFTKLELDFIYSFLTQIKDTDRELSNYKINIKELSNKMNKRLQEKDIEYLFDTLMKKEFRVRNKKELTVYSFFTYLSFDKETKELTVDFNTRLKPHLIDLKSYAHGNLKYIHAFRSEYTKRMYMLCKQWLEKKGSITLNIDELREMFDVPNYSFYDIKRRIIEKTRLEFLDKKADIFFEVDYKKDIVKEGAKVVSITLHLYKANGTDKTKRDDDFTSLLKQKVYYNGDTKIIINITKIESEKDYVMVNMIDDSYNMISDKFHISQVEKMVEYMKNK